MGRMMFQIMAENCVFLIIDTHNLKLFPDSIRVLFHQFNIIFLGVIGLEAYIWSGRFYIGILVAALLHLIVFLVLYFKLRKPFLSQLEREDSIWLKLCIIPLLFYVLVYSIMIWPADVVEHPENLLGIFLLVVQYCIKNK